MVAASSAMASGGHIVWPSCAQTFPALGTSRGQATLRVAQEDGVLQLLLEDSSQYQYYALNTKDDCVEILGKASGFDAALMQEMICKGVEGKEGFSLTFEWQEEAAVLLQLHFRSGKYVHQTFDFRLLQRDLSQVDRLERRVEAELQAQKRQVQDMIQALAETVQRREQEVRTELLREVDAKVEQIQKHSQERTQALEAQLGAAQEQWQRMSLQMEEMQAAVARNKGEAMAAAVDESGRMIAKAAENFVSPAALEKRAEEVKTAIEQTRQQSQAQKREMQDMIQALEERVQRLEAQQEAAQQQEQRMSRQLEEMQAAMTAVQEQVGRSREEAVAAAVEESRRMIAAAEERLVGPAALEQHATDVRTTMEEIRQQSQAELAAEMRAAAQERQREIAAVADGLVGHAALAQHREELGAAVEESRRMIAAAEERLVAAP